MKPQVFQFDSYNFNPQSGIVVFNYSFDNGDKFTEKIVLPKPIKKLTGNNKEAFNKSLFNLFLITGISYYKIYAPKTINLGEFKLSKEQADFWNKTYTKGLGEFWYKNKLDFRRRVKFPHDNNFVAKGIAIKTGNKNLVPLGGGKDSIVTLEMLKAKKQKFDLFSLRQIQLITDVAKISGEKMITVDRQLDQKILNLKNKTGIYNGHIPFSAYLNFLLITVAILYNYKTIVASHEKSANYGNVKYLGTEINHQWSKSLEFEKMFSEYIKNFISPSLKYYSILRPMDELAITKEFIKYEKYFPIFSSCNLANFKLAESEQKRWCGKCPKCVFTWTLLGAYLPKEKLIGIFGKDISTSKEFKNLTNELLGKKKIKPFECVGTPEEMEKAMAMARKKVLILGFAREGLSSYNYLRKNLAEADITIADQNTLAQFAPEYRKVIGKDKNLKLNLGKSYLKNLDSYDVIIKTAGLKLDENIYKKYQHKITANLNIFLAERQGKIIGITGTKGKSTTSSLIYEILKTAGKKTELIGNIGKPFLDYLNKDSKDTIFVAEISSYQAETLRGHLDVGIVTSFYPEHLNYHGSLAKYFEAKMNLIKNSEIVFYNKNFKKVENFIKKTKVKSIGFTKTRNMPANILGEHNQSNIAVAEAVTKYFKIKQADIDKAIKNFRGLPHRLELVGNFKGINFYNDLLSTTPESTIEAIHALQDKNLETLIVGGFDRGLDYKKLAREIVKARIKNVIYWPHTGETIAREIKKSKNPKINLVAVKNMKQTIAKAYELTSKNATVVISPAAPSYDFYKNYEEKGEEFKKLVKSCR